MIFWFFEHSPTLDDLPEKVFICGCFLSLGALTACPAQGDQGPVLLFSPSQEFRLPDTLILCPWPNRLLA